MNDIMLTMKYSLIKLPSPSNIIIWWNMGFMMGMILILQIITGLFLSLHYSSFSKISFMSVNHIIRDVNYGWLFQIMHTNGASLFFILIYIHVARGIYYSSYKMILTWISGFLILILLMLSAFLGYVLPWGQMSFWGATVITNLLSAVPYIGNTMVFWIWGGFSIDSATLSRFFIFHFLFPLIIIVFVFFHLIFLHEKGSGNPLGSNSNFDKIPFFMYFWQKDIFSLLITMMIFSFIILFSPMLLMDPENFISANPMTTPIHIQPEWYFLFAYAILRSIPNKLGGVISLAMSLIILLILPLLNKNFLSKSFLTFSKFMFWFLIILFILLTFIGSKPVEEPFIVFGQIISFCYFFIFLFI